MMMKDQFANYVVQNMLDEADPLDQQRLKKIKTDDKKSKNGAKKENH